jgi:hypothetical protein
MKDSHTLFLDENDLVFQNDKNGYSLPNVRINKYKQQAFDLINELLQQ